MNETQQSLFLIKFVNIPYFITVMTLYGPQSHIHGPGLFLIKFVNIPYFITVMTLYGPQSHIHGPGYDAS